MILFKEDWDKYPDAIVDWSTKNTSWVEMVLLYEAMGVENCYWPLALIDNSLLGVDPHDVENLTLDQMMRIEWESCRNPWYYYREVARAPSSSGGVNNPIKADRGFLGSLWLTHNHIDTTNIQLRQTGKTFRAYKYVEWVLTVGTHETLLLWFTTNDNKRVDSIKDIRRGLKALPSYIFSTTKGDSAGQSMVTNARRGNSIVFEVGQKDKRVAEQKGRGYTVANYVADEIAEMINSHTSIGAAVGSGNKARADAKKAGEPYARMHLCTAGDLLRPEGEFFFTMAAGAMPFSEVALFDCTDEEDLFATVSSNSRYKNSPTVDLTMSYRQLGLSEEEFQVILEDSVKNNPNDLDKVKRECFSIWSSGGKGRPLSPEQADVVSKSKIAPVATERSKERVTLRWYVKESTLKILNDNYRLGLGIDTSNASGKDTCSITITDLATGVPVGRADINRINLSTYGIFVISLMLRFDKMLLIIENKSSGQGIIDATWLKLHTLGIDPFKRIFNNIFQKPEKYNKQYETILSTPMSERTESWYNQFKGEFGVCTSSKIREQILDTSLIQSVQYAGNKISDSTLINQMISLEERNGRIDHPVGGNDDAVFSYLLTIWFCLYGRNIRRYNIPTVLPLSLAVKSENGNATDEEKKLSRQLTYLEEVRINIEEEYRLSNSRFYSKQLLDKLEQVNESIMQLGGEPKNIEQFVEAIRMEKQKGLVR